MTHILLVEDDVKIAGSLGDFLSETGFEVDFAYDGEMCLRLAQDNRYAAIIMDVAMPILDGVAACRTLRDVYYDSTPVLFLTARDTLDDKLDGYDAGGDDYLVKPFAPEELVARVRALLKRRRNTDATVQTLGDLTLDHGQRLAYRDNNRLDLHDIQFRMLAELVRAAPDVVSREELESRLWPDQPPESDPLRTHIYRLRQQLDKPFATPILETVHGRGYRIAREH